MTVYLVAYDLIKEGKGTQDYQPLWDELKRLGAFRTQLSLWLVALENTPQQVVEHFKHYVDKDDRIWCSRLAAQHWYVNAIGGTNEWLKQHPPT